MHKNMQGLVSGSLAACIVNDKQHFILGLTEVFGYLNTHTYQMVSHPVLDCISLVFGLV